jgi:two-component system, OmpR family, KDP operon response regulator KdpE
MSHGARILVVDDEPQIRRSLQIGLEGKGYAVTTAARAEQALEAIESHRPDVIVTDLLMPGMDGLELTRRIRNQSVVPIIVLSAIGDEQKKVEALELGADDYVTKPFGMDELLARIKSVLRRAAGAKSAEPVWRHGGLSVNFDRREVRVSGDLVKLTPKEYDLLKYMIENAGKVLTQKMLLTAVWGPAHSDQAQYLRVFVAQLRKKLEKDSARPHLILTDPGVGYRFSPVPLEQ